MNSKKRLCFLFSIILLIVSLVVSCDLQKEANTTIAVRDDVIVVGSAGGQLQRPVDVVLDIQNASGSFKAIDDSTDVSNWLIIPSYPDAKGVKVVVNGAVVDGASSVALQITIDPKLLISAIDEARLEFKVPASFLNDRLNDVQVQTTGKQCFMNIIGKDSQSSYVLATAIYLLSAPDATALTDIQGFVGEPISEYVMEFSLVNNSFARDLEKDVFDISAWISPEVPGLKYSLYENVKKGDAAFKVLVSGTPEVSYNAALMKLKLNADILTTLNRNMYSAYMPTLTIKPQAVSKVVAKDVEVSGLTTMDEENPTVNNTITITLGNGVKFLAKNSNTDVSAWFTNSVPGLEYTLSSTLSENATSAVVLISGSPTSPSVEEVQISIPYSDLNLADTDRSDSGFGGLDRLYINPNGAHYNITKGNFINWRLLDLASFRDMSATVLSENKDMTTAADGSPIDWEDAANAVIASGEGVQVNYTKGFSRHGFVLKGFTYRYRDDKSEVNPDNILYRWTNADFAGDGDFDVALDENMWNDNVEDIVTGRPIDIFAVWEPDSSGKTENEEGDEVATTAWWVKEDISEKGKYFPVTYNANGNSAYLDWLMYNEVKLPAKGYKMLVNGISSVVYSETAPQQVYTYTSDFAIGEHVVTGYMVEELKSWNKGDETAEGSKGFAIPDVTNDFAQYTPTDDENKVAYGQKITKPDGTVINDIIKGMDDPSCPVVLTPSQAFVLSNAFTAYYNDMHSSDDGFVPLTYAYTVDRQPQADDLSNVVKTIANADTLWSLNTKFGDPSYAVSTATGFRLPTAAEYDFATRVIPNNDYTTAEAMNISEDADNSYKGTMYPQFQLLDQISGGRAVLTSTDKKDAGDYSWGSNNSYIDNTVYMRGFEKRIGTIVDKRPNNIGLYGMQSNVFAICDLTVNATSIRLMGAQYATRAYGSRTSDFRGNSFSIEGNYNHKDPGLRLVRTLN